MSSFEQIELARERLRGHAHVTPVFTSRTLNSMVGAEVFLKCENFQRAGAFKFRGAFNAISQLSEKEREQGVITFSSGNHAQAMALAGQLLGAKVVVVMPRDAPSVKRAATEAYGAKVVPYDSDAGSRDEIAQALAREHGYTLVPPFDHPNIVAGQGTAALELAEQAPDLDWLLVPCGGGGLLSGSALAMKGRFPKCQVVGVEPQLGDDATRSFYSKQLQVIPVPKTIADGTRTTSLGPLTFSLILENVDAMKTVSEAAIKEAARFTLNRMKLVVEPSGALGLAALLSGAAPVNGRVGIILSGGNVDGSTMAEILNSP